MKMRHVKILLILMIVCMAWLNTQPYGFKDIKTWYMLNKITMREDVYCEENKNSKIYYTENDKDYISTVRMTVDTYYPLLLNDFGLERGKKPCIIIHPSRESLINVTRTEKAPMGAYNDGVIHILSPALWTGGSDELAVKDIFLREGPIIHELVHFVTDLKINGNCPIWFAEGVSLYYEYKYTGVEWQKDLQSASEKITYRKLADNFNGLDEALAYRRAFDVVNNIVQGFGEDKLQELIRCI